MEGLVNALIHRDYLIVGSEVHIDIFDNRLEIYSPGGMVDGSSLEGRDLRHISSQRRNPVLADVFSRLQLMKHRGGGFKKILEDYDFQEHMTEALMPKFMAEHRDFLLTLYNLNYVEGQEQGDNTADDGEMAVIGGNIREKIIEAIKNDNTISATQLAELLGVSKRTTERYIKELREKGLLERQGAARGGWWNLKV